MYVVLVEAIMHIAPKEVWSSSDFLLRSSGRASCRGYCCRQGSSLTDAANSALAVERLALAHSNAAAPEGGATQDVLRAITRPVLAQMDGHEGSIHRCSLADELVLVDVFTRSHPVSDLGQAFAVNPAVLSTDAMSYRR